MTKNTSSKEIEIRIDLETGDTEIEAFGFKDGTCRAATEGFEKALGQVKSRKMKDTACDTEKVRLKEKK